MARPMRERAQDLVKLLTRMKTKRPDLYAVVKQALEDFRQWEKENQ